LSPSFRSRLPKPHHNSLLAIITGGRTPRSDPLHIAVRLFSSNAGSSAFLCSAQQAASFGDICVLSGALLCVAGHWGSSLVKANGLAFELLGKAEGSNRRFRAPLDIRLRKNSWQNQWCGGLAIPVRQAHKPKDIAGAFRPAESRSDWRPIGDGVWFSRIEAGPIAHRGSAIGLARQASIWMRAEQSKIAFAPRGKREITANRQRKPRRARPERAHGLRCLVPRKSACLARFFGPLETDSHKKALGESPNGLIFVVIAKRLRCGPHMCG